MIDPRREAVIDKINSIKHVIPVLSSKGGVGKSLVSTGIAVILAHSGKSVGLLDLDFWGPSDHLILGANTDVFPLEDKGIVPLKTCKLWFMTTAFYTLNQPLPMRGSEYTDALLELMAVTRWDNIDYLVIDMPPGLGDPFLNLVNFFRNGDYVVVSTPSPLSLIALDNTLQMLLEQNIKVVGVVENMNDEPFLSPAASLRGVNYLGYIPFIETIDQEIGGCKRFSNSQFVAHLKPLVAKMLELID